MLSVVHKKSSPIRNIHVWTSTFMVYASVMLEKWPNKGLEFLKYMQTVRTAASRGCPGGWVLYDEQYRLRKAHFPASSWASNSLFLSRRHIYVPIILRIAAITQIVTYK
jgi:hypothetical protein